MAHYAIENADHIFVQTERQQQLLLERFGRQGEIIRNPVDISPSDPDRWPDRSTRNTILWIGRLRHHSTSAPCISWNSPGDVPTCPSS